MKPRSQSPLIRSSVVLRGVATALTLTSLGGMTSFAATHVQNAAAPLQPAASTTTAGAATAATPKPAATPRTSTRRSTTITGATTTTTPARTKTKSS